MNLRLTIEEVGALATAVGVIFAAVQLRSAAKQAMTDFEDSIGAEYRTLASKLPTEALLGDPLTDDQHKESLDEFYHYFDLTNGQIFLRQKGRVSPRTFAFWRDGIKAHLARPAFTRAWVEIGGRSPKDFNELRRLIAEEFKHDPKDWDKCPCLQLIRQMNIFRK